ncbi:TPA: hypothetical protein J0W29_000893 [Enterococcus faecium]|uniref:aldolase catalytic domain-containing protein n=1 Tax=Enterococcus faecium TaxID=1352 RepID=UPI0002A1FE03|nr:aldolase catalytic domain-containing protein [Enterococcus faecium]ELA59267.1 hypothetical protein OGG_03546 [Enterococcus faecium EnGen0013]EOF93742.1 hypothetical protein SKG_01159 [Enterococcus faecium EnGen0166]MDV7710311.1 aldolase catalytic domain-containing protein [Enterococcus faecium]MDW3723009.1 aldolase catalytic domain-containing protein [Enterococcus faecium]HAQ7384499.1 hypothetical protein [Enterococcus faecium]
MEHAKLLDCTLRDGAYLIDKNFGDTTIKGIVSGLVKAKIDFIEIGFFQNDGFGEGKTVFLNSADAKKYIPTDKNGCEFTVLADYSRYSVDNLDACTGDSIDAVRECFFKHERFDALDACRTIKEKGYKLFVQPVDILGYTDKELIEFIELVNAVEPYCLSIVDTFGSMYQEDLHRVFELINHNLIPTCKIGFHSHNNMQLSNALSQEFIRMTVGKRQVVVDGTISGMGRGAGNTPTELIAQYMTSKCGASYDMDVLLDIIDGYMDNIRSRCQWGYTTPYFVAGCYSAHVNNIAYLTNKNGIRSKDLRFILNKIGADARKRYDYDLLDKTYLELLESDIDDAKQYSNLKESLCGRSILILAPGKSADLNKAEIKRYIEENNPIVITVQFIHEDIECDYVFMSNVKRYRYWRNNDKFIRTNKILMSNIVTEAIDAKDYILSITKYIKCGWEHMDNSTILLMRLLDTMDVKEIVIAGFDGYDYASDGNLNYASKFLELSSAYINPGKLNSEIESMLCEFNKTRIHKNMQINFLTASRFERIFN